jgi:stage II sporulation protein D
MRMKRSWCVSIVGPVLLVATACAARPEHTAVPAGFSGRLLRVRTVEKGVATVRQLPLEEYVQASILSEFAPADGDAAVVEKMLEVQAVLSRTYALAHLDRHKRDGYDLGASTHCQLYQPGRLTTSRWAGAAARAVLCTQGMVVWFDRSPASTLFHADCGGHTSTPVAVWGGTPTSYLPPLRDDGPAATAHREWTFGSSREAIRRALNADVRTAPGKRLDEIEILQRDDAGRAVRVRIAGEHRREVKGEVFRDVLTRSFGARSLRSTWFDVREDRSTYTFAGRGFGHGVGLCQAGALARVSAGASPAAVLTRYFPGTRLITLP